MISVLCIFISIISMVLSLISIITDNDELSFVGFYLALFGFLLISLYKILGWYLMFEMTEFILIILYIILLVAILGFLILALYMVVKMFIGLREERKKWYI